MIATGYRTTDYNRLPHPWSTGRDSSGHGSSARAHRRQRAPLVAALAVTALLLSGVYAVAMPVPELSQTDAITAAPGATVTLEPSDVFNYMALPRYNPRFTEATFSTTDYYESDSGINSSGNLVVKAKSAADLNALSPRPPSPFTVTADVTVTSDNQRDGSGTLSFVTTYDRTADATPPTQKTRDPQNAPAGTLVSAWLPYYFDNLGTNARYTSATFSTLEYYEYTLIAGDNDDYLYVQVKTTEALNALASPPPDPFTVTADVTVTNDEGATATGTIPFKTGYHRTADDVVQPTFSAGTPLNSPPGTLVSASIDYHFDDEGTNPRFTAVTFSTTEYYDTATIGLNPGVNDDRVYVQAKSTAALNALDPRPPSPFTVTADVTMTNDEGATASGTISFKTYYNRTADDVVQPTFRPQDPQNAPAGTMVSAELADYFDDEGTNARFTEFTLSTDEYYNASSIGTSVGVNDDVLYVQPKTAAELNALASPPPSPFTVTATVTMTNDEGATATGTISFKTAYVRNPTSGDPPSATQPTFRTGDPVLATVGILVSTTVEDWFDNPGTNPRFTAATFSTMEYYVDAYTGLGAPNYPNRLWVQARNAAGLNALESPPQSPFTVTANVTMANDEGQTATGTIPFKTTYVRNPTSGGLPSPTVKTRDPQNATPGTLVSAKIDAWFDEAGTSPRYTSATFSTEEYYTETRFSGDRLYVQAKTAAELNALDSPPSSPFTVTADVEFVNNEGSTGSGTISFETTYARTPTSDDPPPPATTPTFSGSTPHTAAPGTTHSLDADDWFDDAGTNPKFTSATFSTEEYYTTAEISDGVLQVQVKTAAELNALDSPPSSPFTVLVTVTMSNDEEQTATGLISFETTYDRDPALSQTQPISAPPGTLVAKSAEDVFDSAGTNPVFTAVSFSTSDYYDADDTGIKSGKLHVKVKTAAELSALDSPPDSPFEVTATVTMSNDEEKTATGTITFKTSYVREPKQNRDDTSKPPADEVTTDPPAEGSESPTFSQTGVISAPPGTLVAKSADDLFDNAGTNPVLVSVTFSTADYYDADDTGIKSGSLHVKVKTATELNALDSPPDSPFTVTATVTMTNDERQTAGGAISFRTSYVKESNEDEEEDDDEEEEEDDEE